MKALIDHTDGEKELVTVKESLREFLNKQFEDNWTFQLTFYKEKYGHTVNVAEVFFSHPYRIVLRYQWLTETEQKQFIGFIADHVTTSTYGQAFNLEMSER